MSKPIFPRKTVMFPDPKRVTCAWRYSSARARWRNQRDRRDERRREERKRASRASASRAVPAADMPARPWCSRSRRRCRRPRRARPSPSRDLKPWATSRARCSRRRPTAAARRAAHAGAGVLRGLEPVSGEFFPSHSRVVPEADGNQEHQLISMRSARPGWCPGRAGSRSRHAGLRIHAESRTCQPARSVTFLARGSAAA